ncbi:helix-turn-helix domain-containing protein [Gordonia terrae]|uniref:helix-turn-helix transcriptional regulator n=1 Tax=Gordonia hongkongensis TaxID=1701090 RepID=UPI0022B31BBC|nr:helix-turn-helix domain-containing protein [Gordonia terrae]
MNTNTLPAAQVAADDELMARAARRMSVAETAEYLGIAKQTLYGLRHRGQGPVGYRIGGRAFYDRADVDAWIAAQKALDVARRTA